MSISTLLFSLKALAHFSLIFYEAQIIDQEKLEDNRSSGIWFSNKLSRNISIVLYMYYQSAIDYTCISVKHEVKHQFICCPICYSTWLPKFPILAAFIHKRSSNF